jgi:hypothetical protein
MSETIIVVGGYWSTNIGNSFFQLGAQFLLERIFPDGHVVMLSDQPGYWKVSQGNPANAFILLEHIPMDYLVIQGPFLRPEFDSIWAGTLRKLQRKGVKIIVLSAGMMDYTPSAIAQYRGWLTEFPPYIFTTRDSDTFEVCADLADHAYDGIDLAFFVPDLFEPVPMELRDFVVFNFDKIPEPRVEIRGEFSSEGNADYEFEFANKYWHLHFAKLRTLLSHTFKFYPFIDAFLPKQYPETVDGRLIIRTDHRFNPLIEKKVFKAPNSFVSDIPYTYLNLYANAKLTLSNRVHACVATLAYGNPAMLISKTPRAKLLERVGASAIIREPVTLPKEEIEEEKAQLVDFVRSVI